MRKNPAIAVFDIGKTNKKLLVFDGQYNLVRELTVGFNEIEDDDGYPCEDLAALTTWMLEQFRVLKNDPEYEIKAVNFSTYGASLVYINKAGKPVGYLYNYLKPYPQETWDAFCRAQGNVSAFCEATSTPLMGHLNAGMQLYWLRTKKPGLFKETATVLHFPQYLSFLFTGKRIAEMTNVGCHSAMWDFHQMRYHSWLKTEQLHEKLAPIIPGSNAVVIEDATSGQKVAVGTGLHDSSAAIIPYLCCFDGPFVILSTGTWAISLNPFNQVLPDAADLSKGGLSYLSYKGIPVKTSMLFAGNEHDQQVKRIAAHFSLASGFYKTVLPDREMLLPLFEKTNKESADEAAAIPAGATTPGRFQFRDLQRFQTAGAAYHQLLKDIIEQQKISTQLVLDGKGARQLYVDGGFCKNELYMQLLATAFPETKVYATTMTQGTALGAALAIHDHWNHQPVPASLISLKAYAAVRL
ncbi:MAG TPA: FGGY family carbohydrate kinase [Niabella sp.]